jgi:hypothetical protein
VNFPCEEVAFIGRQEVKFVENNSIVVSLVDPLLLPHKQKYEKTTVKPRPPWLLAAIRF